LYSLCSLFQLAVAHSFGGTHSKAKAEWFVEATEQWMKENCRLFSLLIISIPNVGNKVFLLFVIMQWLVFK